MYRYFTHFISSNNASEVPFMLKIVNVKHQTAKKSEELGFTDRETRIDKNTDNE